MGVSVNTICKATMELTAGLFMRFKRSAILKKRLTKYELEFIAG